VSQSRLVAKVLGWILLTSYMAVSEDSKMIQRPIIDVPSQASYLKYVLSKSQELGLGSDPQFLGLLNQYCACPDDSEVSELVREKIVRAELFNLIAPDPFRTTNPAPACEFAGDVMLGIVENSGKAWRVSPKLLTSNLLCLGRSGGGKTNLLLLLAAQVLQKRLATVRIYDRKLDYVCLSIFPNFVYWLLEHYYINWIQPPPGLSHKRWVPVLFEIFGNHLDIRVAGRNLLTNATLWACEQRRSEETGYYPTLIDIRNIIRSRKYAPQSHQARYQETDLNRIEGLIDVLGEHVCSQRQLDWDTFLNSSWAISLFGIPTDYQNLFISVTSSAILLHKMATGKRVSS
jgi:hypothetical protein